MGFSDVNNFFVVDVFKSLFLVFIKWEFCGDLIFDIIIYFLSDDKYCFKYLRFYFDVGLEYIDFFFFLIDSNGLGLVNDLEYGWILG